MYDVTNSTHLIYCIIFFFIFSPLESAFYQGTFHSNTRIEIIIMSRNKTPLSFQSSQENKKYFSKWCWKNQFKNLSLSIKITS